MRRSSRSIFLVLVSSAVVLHFAGCEEHSTVTSTNTGDFGPADTASTQPTTQSSSHTTTHHRTRSSFWPAFIGGWAGSSIANSSRTHRTTPSPTWRPSPSHSTGSHSSSSSSHTSRGGFGSHSSHTSS